MGPVLNELKTDTNADPRILEEAEWVTDLDDGAALIEAMAACQDPGVYGA